jgi:glyoxalase superfamily protein
VARRIQLAVDCADPDRLAAFWADALGYEPQPAPAGFASWAEFSRTEGDPDEAWNAIVDPAGTGPRILFHKVPEPKRVKNRLHLDVHLSGHRADRSAVDAEARRLVGLGARHLRTEDDGMDYFAVLADPEGNEFCIM